MGNIFIPHSPQMSDSSSSRTALPVRSSQFVKWSDTINWLNFFARRVLPYRRMASSHNTRSTSFLYPAGSPDTDQQRYLLVMVGLRLGYGSDTGSPEDTVDIKSQANTTGISLDFENVAAGAGFTHVDYQEDDKPISFITGRIEIEEGLNLISLATTDVTSAIDGYAAWELPPGLYSYNVDGGLGLDVPSVDSGETHISDSTDYYSIENITSTKTDNIIDNAEVARKANGRIAFAAGGWGAWNGSTYTYTGMRWECSSATFVKYPQGGIYLPPAQGVKGVESGGIEYIRYKAAVLATCSTSASWAMYSEGLGASSSTQTFSTASPNPDWFTSGGNHDNDVTTWLASYDGVAFNARASGDWVYLELKKGASNVNVYGIIIWQDDA